MRPIFICMTQSQNPTTISFKKEFYKFTKYSTLIDESLNLMFNNLIK